jgi:hypothetical protein
MPSRDPRKLWTVTIHGYAPFECFLEGNPSIEHHGGTSVHHLFGTLEEVAFLRTLGESRGLKMEARGLEWAAPTKQVLPTPEEVQVLCEKCPTCPWWDPVTLGEGKSCALHEAPIEYSETLAANSQALREAAAACPVTISPLSP